MKKLKLDFQHLGNAKVLTRSQLKKIIGGQGGSGDEGDEKCKGGCSGGDGSTWTAGCRHTGFSCICSRTDANLDDCALA